MTDRLPVIVIGAGHNGLVCAAYLARAGRKVVVLEQGDSVGGAATTREFHPGFRVSAVAHLLYALDARLSRDLDLARHGYALARSGLRTVALAEGRPALVLDRGAVLRGELADADRAAYAEWWRRRGIYAAALARLNHRVPPRLRFDSWRERLRLLPVAFDIRRLGRRDLREFLRLVSMSMHDWLQESVADPLLQGALAFEAVLGTKYGPRSGGTVYSSWHRASMGLHTGEGYSLPRGGMGALSQALAEAARAAGAQIRLGTAVRVIEVAGGRVSAVTTATGERIAAGAVMAAVHPQTALLSLLGARQLEAEFARRVQHIRSIGTAAKLHLALTGKPRFSGVDEQDVGERLVLAPDPDCVEQAFNPAKYRQYSDAPVMEITVPSVHDASLAPAGQHVLSAIVQYAPYDLAGGWDGARAAFTEQVIDRLARHAPGLREQIIAAELLTPVDIERQYGMAGGHWHHGELALDQSLMLRPVPGAAQYATPIAGLYLGSAGCHPGGDVSGVAGRNAAKALLAGEAR